MEIIYSPKALEDLIDIYSYIPYSLYEPNLAEVFLNRIRDNIRKLDQMPLRHPLVDWEPWHSMGMRIFPIGNYEIYYLVDREQSIVRIIRIIYGGRDTESMIKDCES